jgi:beta-xylosidase
MARASILNSVAAAALLVSSTAAAAQAPACPGPSSKDTSLPGLGAKGPQLLLNENFPDPFLARFGRTYFAYATGNQIGGAQMNVQLIRSRDLKSWTAPAEAFPAATLPAWVDKSHPQVWAPEVMKIGERFVLYYNARHATLTRAEGPPQDKVVRQRHCLGAAVADGPEGPFTSVDTPLVCSEFPDGVIDANPFHDGDSLYLYFKDDGNCCGRGSAIHVQGLSADGLAAVGPATKLIANNDEPGSHDDWEWLVVEAPTMVKRANSYVLFYSGNFFGNKNYSVAYLHCESPRGPCRDPGENPILWSHGETPLIGPGHQSILELGGRTQLFFHGWNRDPDGREQPGVHKRCLYTGRVQWTAGPSGKPRPVIVGGEPRVMPGASAQ